MVAFSTLFTAGLVAAVANAAPTMHHKRIAQVIADSTKEWVKACDAAGGGAECNTISQAAFTTLLAAGKNCDQQDAADKMVDLAKKLKNDPDMIKFAQIFAQQPRNAPDSLQVPYCQTAPKNKELDGFFHCQFAGTVKNGAQSKFSGDQTGNLPLGVKAVNPPGSCPASKTPVDDGKQLTDTVKDPGTPEGGDAGAAASGAAGAGADAGAAGDAAGAGDDAGAAAGDAAGAGADAGAAGDAGSGADAGAAGDAGSGADAGDAGDAGAGADTGDAGDAAGAGSDAGDAGDAADAGDNSGAAADAGDNSGAADAGADAGDAADAGADAGEAAANAKDAGSKAADAKNAKADKAAASGVADAGAAANGAKAKFPENGPAAQKLNAQFADLKANSPCKDGEQACVGGDFAQCVAGKFQTTKCSGGTKCFALPLVNKVGTSVTCTTDADAQARIAATGAKGGVTGA